MFVSNEAQTGRHIASVDTDFVGALKITLSIYCFENITSIRISMKIKVPKIFFSMRAFMHFRVLGPVVLCFRARSAGMLPDDDA